MRSRLYIIILTAIPFFSFFFPCYSQSSVILSKQVTQYSTILQFNTSKTAIIPFNQRWGYPFDKTYTAAELTQEDVNNIDSLLLECVTNWNNLLDKDHKYWVIDLKKNSYRKQLVVATNKNGEKEVWVNCFCRDGDNGWQTEVLLVADGGQCYFNFKINLSTKKYYHLAVNGLA